MKVSVASYGGSDNGFRAFLLSASVLSVLITALSSSQCWAHREEMAPLEPPCGTLDDPMGHTPASMKDWKDVSPDLMVSSGITLNWESLEETQAAAPAVADWLKSEGFYVDESHVHDRFPQLKFGGTAAQVKRVFGITIRFSDAPCRNPMSDQKMCYAPGCEVPVIPARFKNIILAIDGLSNMNSSTPAVDHRVCVVIGNKGVLKEPD